MGWKWEPTKSKLDEVEIGTHLSLNPRHDFGIQVSFWLFVLLI